MTPVIPYDSRVILYDSLVIKGDSRVSICDSRVSFMTPEWFSTTPGWSSTTPKWASTTPEWSSTTPGWSSTTPKWASTTPEWSSFDPTGIQFDSRITQNDPLYSRVIYRTIRISNIGLWQIGKTIELSDYRRSVQNSSYRTISYIGCPAFYFDPSWIRGRINMTPINQMPKCQIEYKKHLWR
jgi:hypothetical protein